MGVLSMAEASVMAEVLSMVEVSAMGAGAVALPISAIGKELGVKSQNKAMPVSDRIEEGRCQCNQLGKKTIKPERLLPLGLWNWLLFRLPLSVI
jgi:hypothetical protein